MKSISDFSLEGLDTPSARVFLCSGLALDERQFVDEVELLLAFHEQGEVVLDARFGEPYLTEEPVLIL